MDAIFVRPVCLLASQPALFNMCVFMRKYINLTDEMKIYLYILSLITLSARVYLLRCAIAVIVEFSANFMDTKINIYAGKKKKYANQNINALRN